MADYKFDGKDLRHRGTKLGTLDGKYIRDAKGHRLGEFDGKIFRDSKGARIAEFDGRAIRDTHGHRIGEIADVTKAIEGIGGASLVAMWLFFVR